MLDLFRLVGGIDIQNDSLSNNVYLLHGVGEPGGDSAAQDAAPIGSTFYRTDLAGNKLQVFYKIASNNVSADWTQVADKSYVDNAVAGISWREPAVVRSTATTLPTSTATQTITVDGVVVSDNQRVLFTDLTVDPNVYVYNQATGTFAEDINSATSGDALFITSGTSVGNRWTFNGTQWVLFGAETDVSEIVFIDSYLGKTLGNSLPVYTTNYAISDSQTIVSAVSDIDTLIGTGEITNASGNFVLTSSLATNGSNGSEGTLTITNALNALNTQIGNRTFTTGTNYPLTTNGETITASLEKLNVAVKDILIDTLQVSGSVSSTPSTLAIADSIPLSLATEVTWMVQVRETATQANRRALQIHAVTDGTTVDFTRFAELTLGAGVVGFGADVVIDGTNIALQLKATNNYDFIVKRVAVSNF